MLNLKPIKIMPVREQAASSIREAIITKNLKQLLKKKKNKLKRKYLKKL